MKLDVVDVETGRAVFSEFTDTDNTNANKWPHDYDPDCDSFVEYVFSKADHWAWKPSRDYRVVDERGLPVARPSRLNNFQRGLEGES